MVLSVKPLHKTYAAVVAGPGGSLPDIQVEWIVKQNQRLKDVL